MLTHSDAPNIRFSGLSVAHYLRKYVNLQSFVIYEASEKTRGGAGTWKDNTVWLACPTNMTLCNDHEADFISFGNSIPGVVCSSQELKH